MLFTNRNSSSSTFKVSAFDPTSDMSPLRDGCGLRRIRSTFRVGDGVSGWSTSEVPYFRGATWSWTPEGEHKPKNILKSRITWGWRGLSCSCFDLSRFHGAETQLRNETLITSNWSFLWILQTQETFNFKIHVDVERNPFWLDVLTFQKSIHVQKFNWPCHRGERSWIPMVSDGYDYLYVPIFMFDP